jgi:hypothetical protein
MNQFHLTLKSANAKTGPIPVSTTSADSCPDSCGMFKACYAKKGPLMMHWKKVSTYVRGMDFHAFVDAIRKLPDNQLWRHNQAGDLVGINNQISIAYLRVLVGANRGKRGFTYTHKPMSYPGNIEAIQYANNHGFTVNLSADNADHADSLKALNIAPVVVVLEKTAAKVTYTPAGNKVVVCPAQNTNKINCSTCGLCQLAERPYIIGFRKH